MDIETGERGKGHSTCSSWPSPANVILLAPSDCNLPNGKHTEQA